MGEAANSTRPAIADLRPDTTVTTTLLVLRKDVRQKQNGDPFLSLTLGDRTGQIEANVWDNVADVQQRFERDQFVRVRAAVVVYRDKPQLRIERLERVAEESVQLGDFLPVTRADIPAMWRELRGRVAAMRNPHLRRLLEAILDDPAIAAAYQKAPAAKALHHACLGGLLEHVTSLARLAERVLPNYPFVDGDLVLAGIVVHDLGKTRELSFERGFAYTTEGQLLGHIVMVLETIQEKLRELPEFPRRLRVALEHLVISHHGEYAFGSPKLPMFPEAMLLHMLDNLDSKMEAMRAQLEQEAGGSGDFTGYSRALDRPLLRLGAWLEGEPEARAAGGRS